MLKQILSLVLLGLLIQAAPDTKKEVHKDCLLRLTPGPCLAFFPSWAYQESRGCRQFVYGGCGGNNNRFTSKEECEKKCMPGVAADICSLPLVQGPCEALGYPWGFDNQLNSCRQFAYGGCQGNANRFSSKEECTKACLSERP